MSLIKRSFPIWADMDRFFDEDSNGSTWSPAINVVNNDDNYEIELAAPGMKKDDFNVEVDNGILTVSCSSTKEEEEKKKNYTRKEFSSRSFSKSFTLPENADEDSINASHEDGVLKVKINKTRKEQAPPRKTVEIN